MTCRLCKRDHGEIMEYDSHEDDTWRPLLPDSVRRFQPRHPLRGYVWGVLVATGMWVLFAYLTGMLQ